MAPGGRNTKTIETDDDDCDDDGDDDDAAANAIFE